MGTKQAFAVTQAKVAIQIPPGLGRSCLATSRGHATSKAVHQPERTFLTQQLIGHSGQRRPDEAAQLCQTLEAAGGQPLAGSHRGRRDTRAARAGGDQAGALPPGFHGDEHQRLALGGGGERHQAGSR